MASTNRSERVRFRYGLCLNDSCPKCKSKEVQQIAARKDFVCAECGKALRECPPPRAFWDKYGKMIIGGGVALVAIILGVVFLAGGDKKTATQQPPVEHVLSLFHR